MSQAPPDIFAFDDYRGFLRSYYAHRKAQGRGFSLRSFSQRAALQSPNYLKLVMDGDRNLSDAMAQRFAKACGLRAAGAEYFRALVAYGQAERAEERERAYQKLSTFRRFRDVYPLDRAHEAYHSHWYIPAIRELAARTDFRADPKWIGRTLMPSISARKAAQALSVLRELGLLVEDEQRGLRQAHALVETTDRPLGHHVVKFHRTMMERAAESIDSVPREQREIAALTLCLSGAQLGALKRSLQQLRRQLLEEYASGPDARRVVQLNFQLFPLSIEEK
ncbi:MAG TPA: TIGR02147 family protein [Polyangiales bacterium]